MTKVVAGTEAGSIKSLVVKSGKPPRTQSIIASLVVEMYEKGQTLDIEFDKKKRTNWVSYGYRLKPPQWK